MSIKYNLEKYFSFSKEEIKDFLLTSLITGFVMFFIVWRNTDYKVVSGIIALIGLLVLSAGSLFTMIAASKYIAIVRGYTAHYTGWIPAAVIGFVVSFTTSGFIPILFPGLIEIKANARHRFGKVFPGENKYDIFAVLASGLLACILLSIFFQVFFNVTGMLFFYHGMLLNALLVFFALLPFTKNIGLHMFYVEKGKYFLLLIFSTVFLTLTVLNSILSVLLSLLITFVLWLFLHKPLSKRFNV